MVSIAAFQAVDPGSIPGHRRLFFFPSESAAVGLMYLQPHCKLPRLTRGQSHYLSSKLVLYFEVMPKSLICCYESVTVAYHRWREAVYSPRFAALVIYIVAACIIL